jgi:hypothetical protein
MGRVLDEIAHEPAARVDGELLAVRGLYSCPTCWSGEEACEACDGSGLVPVRI